MDKWNSGVKTRGVCQTAADLDSDLSASQVQVALPEAHGEDGPSGPLCFWCVSGALPGGGGHPMLGPVLGEGAQR